LFNYSLTEKKLVFNKFNNKIEFFRDYTDCLYSAYGTKWNGNAAAYNGSLFISQNNRLRRFTPLECERLMGFPDDYTYLPKAKDTSRYKAIGNSWPIPVIKWLGKRIKEFFTEKSLPQIDLTQISSSGDCHHKLFLFENDTFIMNQESFINVSPSPNTPVLGELINIVDVDAKEKFYLSTKGIKGIVRRKAERNINMNPSLEKVMSLDF
jgi:DNA (cytosine-5)-methyltransferase 1